MLTNNENKLKEKNSKTGSNKKKAANLSLIMKISRMLMKEN